MRVRGVLLARGGRHAEALSAFDAALALSPGGDAGARAHLAYLRGRSLFALGREEESRHALDQALASPEVDAAAWRAEALALRERLTPRRSPQGAQGKSFSRIGGK
jgi:tetratricopeptide (TPR) repeat protein